MADVLTPEQRKKCMSNIRNKGTRPEERIRKALFAAGFRYRKNDRKLAGCPDVVLPKWRIVIFVHGCFWHGHDGCRYFKLPDTRQEWWKAKINRNRQRDAVVRAELVKAGWRVVEIWECETRKKETLKETVIRLEKLIRANGCD